MSGKNQHVVQRQDGWAVRGEGNSRDTSHHSTQEEAAEVARDIALKQRSDALIKSDFTLHWDGQHRLAMPENAPFPLVRGGLQEPDVSLNGLCTGAYQSQIGASLRQGKPSFLRGDLKYFAIID